MAKPKGFVETLLEVLVILFVAISILLKYAFILCCFIVKIARALFIFGYSLYRQKHQQRRQTRNKNNQNSYSFNRQVHASNNQGSYNNNRQANKTFGNPIKKLHTPHYRSTPVEVKQEICKLPKEFGKNAKLYTAINNQARGIKHVHERHERDFIATTTTSSFSNEKHIIKSLQQNLIPSKFVGQEIHAKGNRYIWETKNANGKSQHLVTVMEPRGGGDGNNFELITAYKRTRFSVK